MKLDELLCVREYLGKQLDAPNQDSKEAGAVSTKA